MVGNDVFREKLFEAIGRKIAEARKQARPHLSQAKLASKVGITRSAVSALEAGHHGVSVVTLCQLAATLEVAPGELLPDDEELSRLTNEPESTPAEFLVEHYLESHG
jgi:transcriptional regulator with XRE-family HTH domain